MASEGTREIEAAKRRLAAAKTQRLSASRMIASANKLAESAREMMKAAKKMASTAEQNKTAAQSLLESSSKEVDEAEAFMKVAENRWEVIDVDVDDSPKTINRKRKRRNAVISAEGAANIGLAERTVHRPDNVNVRSPQTSVGTTASTPSPNCAVQTANNDDSSNDVNTIIVEGSGALEVNGSYERISTTIYGFACFARAGRWRGNAEDFAIFHHSSNYWFIGLWKGDVNTGIGYSSATLYRTMSTTESELPSKSGWMSVGGGISPAPKLKW